MSFPLRWRQTFLALIVIAFVLLPGALAKDRKSSVRWQEGQRQATLLKREDGIYRYSLSYQALRITMAVDPQEVEKTKFTPENVFRLILSIRNSGAAPLKVTPEGVTLELSSHHRVLMPAQRPGDLAKRIQNDSDELIHQSEREIKKHPERKEEIEKRLREHEKFVTEWLEYLSTRALREVTLDPGQPEITGCLLFDTRTKWKGSWKKQEDFVLRVPLQDAVIEFPFSLPPPGAEEPSLRKRSE